MRQTLILFTLLCLTSYGQDTRYRFELDLSLQSITYFGTKSFSSLRHDPYNMSKYEEEYYDIDYDNFSSGPGFNLNFGFNWINSEKGHVLRQTASLFFEIYKEEIHFELVDFNVGDTTHFPNPKIAQDIPLGYSGTTVLQGLGFGYRTDLMYLYRTERITFGGGLSYTFRHRTDEPIRGDLYAPYGSSRGTYSYNTSQMGLTLQIEKSYERWKWFINVHQAFLTLKKDEDFGALYFPDEFTLLPLSQNMDYRFPFTLQLGGAIQFSKIKK